MDTTKQKSGLLSNLLAWFTYPMRANVTLGEWAAFLLLVIVASFLWYTVVEAVD